MGALPMRRPCFLCSDFFFGQVPELCTQLNFARFAIDVGFAAVNQRILCTYLSCEPCMAYFEEPGPQVAPTPLIHPVCFGNCAREEGLRGCSFSALRAREGDDIHSPG